MRFIEDDFYIPVLEALTNYKLATNAKNKKLGQAMSLLDAHVYQKVNDYNMQTKALLAFVRDAFKDFGMKKLT